jgi:Tfp pilus assembly protein PilF
MLMWMVLTLAVAAAPQAPAVQAPSEPRAQAEQLARSGSYRAALERFQALAAKNPDDLEARVWIARLHSLMGNDRRAVDVYESIIATHPKHVDALVGLGDALVRLGRLREAADTLSQAEAMAPENATLLATLGRLHHAMGHPTLSAGYYERALAVDPSAVSTRAEYEAVLRERAHRVELGYIYEHFNIEDMPDPQAATGAVNLRVNEQLRVAGIVQYERRFSQNEARGGGGLEWRLTPALEVHGGALFAGDALILPKTDGYGGIGYTRGRGQVLPVLDRLRGRALRHRPVLGARGGGPSRSARDGRRRVHSWPGSTRDAHHRSDGPVRGQHLLRLPRVPADADAFRERALRLSGPP